MRRYGPKLRLRLRRPALAWVAATAGFAMVIGGATPALTAVAAPAAHALSGRGVSWSAAGWASANGNYVTDVAKTIGASGSGLDGTGVGIALIDTGVAPVQGLPASRVVNGPDLSFDSQASNLRYLDTFGHGTHLAGIMVGNDQASGLKGVAPGAKVTSIKVGASGGVVDVSQVIMALHWVVDHRNDDKANPIKVINLAYGTDSNAILTSDPLLFAVENAFFNGLSVVVAGGNEGNALGRLNNPAMDPYVVKVGSAATQGTVGQGDDQVSSFTSLSPTTQLDVVAPGESIVSLRDPGAAIDLGYPGARVGDTLFRGSGSSQATAVVSAAAALLYQKAPTATPTQMRQWLRNSATPLTGPNASNAAGELNVATALGQPVPNPKGYGGYGSSKGGGSIEASRGSTHVVHNSASLQGIADIFGGFSTNDWVTAEANGTAWKGGMWMGHRVTGDGWTGSSWASRTWAAAGWSGTDWARQTWTDPSWSGHRWSGRYWSGGDWSGRYWSSGNWEDKNFSSTGWASAAWK